MRTTIGRAAEFLGVSVQTIRFYERQGLLPRVPRSGAGYRQFDPDTIRRIQFIKHAQEVGFSLAEIAKLLSLRADPDGSCSDVQTYTRVKIDELEERMNNLQSMKATLENLVARCESALPASACPVLEAFDEINSGTSQASTES